MEFEIEDKSVDDIKAYLYVQLQDQKLIEFDRVVDLVCKKHKFAKISFKKEVKAEWQEKRKENLLSGSENMPNGYFLSPTGVVRETKDGFINVCEYCVVDQIEKTNDNQESIYNVTFPKTGKSVAFSSEDFVDNRRFETILLNHSIYMTTDAIKHFKNYITGYISKNEKNIEIIVRLNRTGWQRIATLDADGKVIYQFTYCNPVVQPQLSYASKIEDRILQGGDLATCQNILNKALCYKGSAMSVLAALAATLVSPLSKKGLSNFILNFSGTTGEGKTLSARIGLSLFGNVAESGDATLVNNMSTTAVGNEILFSFFQDMPTLLDEAGTVKGSPEKKAQFIIDTIFQYFSGQGKTRGNKSLELKKEQRSAGVLFLTMEYDLQTVEKLSGSQEKGYYRRTIEVDTSTGNFLPTREDFDFSVINENFGYISDSFIKSVVENIEDIEKDYLQYSKDLSKPELRGKEKYFAVLHATLKQLLRRKLIGAYEYEKAKAILDQVYKENLETMESITVNRLNTWIHDLAEFIEVNKQSFNIDAKPRFGAFTYRTAEGKKLDEIKLGTEDVKVLDRVLISPTIFENFLVEKGINKKTFLKELGDNEAIVTEKNGKYLKYTTKAKAFGNSRVYAFISDKIEELIGSEVSEESHNAARELADKPMASLPLEIDTDLDNSNIDSEQIPF